MQERPYREGISSGCPGIAGPDGRFVWNGKTLLSGIDPVRRAERAADSVSLSDRTLYFCPSPLYGYGLNRLLSRIETQAPNSAILCIEADPELYEFTQNNIDSSVIANKKLHMTNVCDVDKLYALIRDIWGARAFRRIETLRLTGGWQLFPQLYDSLCDSLRRYIANDWSNALTLTKLGRLYIRNTLRNLTLVTEFSSVANLSFGEAAVLVLGAGPSLDETLNALQRYYINTLNEPANRHFKIVCVDTCLGALKDRGIIPDLAIVLESQHWNLRDFIGCRDWNVPAAFDLSSLPASARVLNGEGFLFFTPWTSLRIFERLKEAGFLPTVVSPLGSVGLTAVELTRQLTRGKIICAGLDFSFTEDKYHARGTPGHRSALNIQTRLRRILNTASYGEYSSAAVSKSGQPIHSNPIMKNYRALFEQEFSADSRLYDIEGTGLPLGIKTLTIEEAIDVLTNKSQEFNTEDTGFHGGHRGLFTEDALGIQRDKDNKEVQLHNTSLCPPCLRLKKPELNSFYDNEKKRLEELKCILTGEIEADKERLSVLISECDYLWAHFPDYAGGRSPNLDDVSFLKRIRTEIDPMLKLIKATHPGT